MRDLGGTFTDMCCSCVNVVVVRMFVVSSVIFDVYRVHIQIYAQKFLSKTFKNSSYENPRKNCGP